MEGAGHGGRPPAGRPWSGEDGDGLVLAAAAAEGAGGELAEPLERVGERGERGRVRIGEGAQRRRGLHRAERAAQAQERGAEGLDALGAALGELGHEPLQRGDAGGGVDHVEGAAQLGVDEARVGVEQAPHLRVHAGLGEDAEVLRAGGAVGGVEQRVGGVGGAVAHQGVERSGHGRRHRPAERRGPLLREAGEEEAAGRGPAILHALAAVLVVLERRGLAVDEVQQGTQLALVGHHPGARRLAGERRGLALEQPAPQPGVELVGGGEAVAGVAGPAAEHQEIADHAGLEEEHVELAHQHHGGAPAARRLGHPAGIEPQRLQHVHGLPGPFESNPRARKSLAAAGLDEGVDGALDGRAEQEIGARRALRGGAAGAGGDQVLVEAEEEGERVLVDGVADRDGEGRRTALGRSRRLVADRARAVRRLVADRARAVRRLVADRARAVRRLSLAALEAVRRLVADGRGQRGGAARDGAIAEAPDLGAQLDEILGDEEGRGPGEGVEQGGGGLRLGVGGATQAPEHGGGDPRIALEEGPLDELERQGQAPLGIGGDAGDQRGGGAAPLGGREAGGEPGPDLVAERGDGPGEEPAGARHVAPHQGLAVVEERPPGAVDGLGRGAGRGLGVALAPAPGLILPAHGGVEEQRRLLVAAARALPAASPRSGALEQAGGHPSLGQRSDGVGPQPGRAQLAARDQRQGQRIDPHVGGGGQRQRQRHPGPDAGPREGARRAAHRHAGGDGHERRRVPLVELLEDDAPQLAPLRAQGESPGDLVERHPGGGGGEPPQIVEEPVGQGHAHAARQGGLVAPFERRLPGRGQGQRGDALPEDRAAIGLLVPIEREQAFEEEVGARAHRRWGCSDRSVARRPW